MVACLSSYRPAKAASLYGRIPDVGAGVNIRKFKRGRDRGNLAKCRNRQ